MKRNNIKKCRNLRKNQTEAEKRLWALLRNRQLDGVKFRRQFPIGSFIVDFYSPEYRLGIEADGGQHHKEEGRRRDELRTKELSRQGVHIARFSNREILHNTEGVCKTIKKIIEAKRSHFPPHLNPLPQGERKQ